MIPIVTPDEMAAIDAAAPEPVEVLIGRAGAAVARTALDMLGGAYGRRVLVVAGGGNNGSDGRVGARILASRGVRAEVVAPGAGPPRRRVDLIVDAAFGTGLSRPYDPIWAVPGTPVLAVDVPSGLRGDTGERLGNPVRADRTITFAALKPAHVTEPGRSLCGRVDVADIGLDASSSRAHLVEASDVARFLPSIPVDSHKWRRAVLGVVGSSTMPGAGALSCGAAFRSGAGYVVRHALDGGPALGVAEVVEHRGSLSDLDPTRFGAAMIGPGLGLDDPHAVRDAVAGLDVPLVVDADALSALGDQAVPLLSSRRAPTILTPHDGEYRRIAGRSPSSDRLSAVRELARDTSSIVVLKGPTTVIATEGGDVRVVDAGDQRLATAGSGDVLTGIVAAYIANGVAPFDAAAAAAYVHGRAALLGPRLGTIASDLIEHLPVVTQALLDGAAT